MQKSQSIQVTNDRFLRLREVSHETGLSRSHIYSLVSQGHFPPPVKLGVRASAWVSGEISDWKQDRIRKSRPNTELLT